MKIGEKGREIRGKKRGKGRNGCHGGDRGDGKNRWKGKGWKGKAENIVGEDKG